MGTDTCRALQAHLVYSGHLKHGLIDGLFRMRTQDALRSYLQCMAYGFCAHECNQSRPNMWTNDIMLSLHAWTCDMGFPAQGSFDDSEPLRNAFHLVAALQKTLNALKKSRAFR